MRASMKQSKQEALQDSPSWLASSRLWDIANNSMANSSLVEEGRSPPDYSHDSVDRMSRSLSKHFKTLAATNFTADMPETSPWQVQEEGHRDFGIFPNRFLETSVTQATPVSKPRLSRATLQTQLPEHMLQELSQNLASRDYQDNELSFSTGPKQVFQPLGRQNHLKSSRLDPLSTSMRSQDGQSSPMPMPVFYETLKIILCLHGQSDYKDVRLAIERLTQGLN